MVGKSMCWLTLTSKPVNCPMDRKKRHSRAPCRWSSMRKPMNCLKVKQQFSRMVKDIVIERVRFLVDETLSAETQVFWDLSDLHGVVFVDDEPQEVEAEDPVFTTISQEELATHPDTYVLSAVPDGFIQEIIESPEQPSGEPYRYEVHYNNVAGESFELMAVGFMDDGFVETSFYDGSYKTSSGKVLYYSSGTPVNSPKGTSAMLVTENGVSFLVFSTMPREQVETLVEDLVRLK